MNAPDHPKVASLVKSGAAESERVEPPVSAWTEAIRHVRRTPALRAVAGPSARLARKIFRRIRGQVTAARNAITVQINNSPHLTFVRFNDGAAHRRAVPVGRALQRALNGTHTVGIGNRASGRQVVMLVVTDLRTDPRVEREARALAHAGYDVTVICPGLPAAIDWGLNVRFNMLHWSAAHFTLREPEYLAFAIFRAALEYTPFAFHAHDANTAYVALAASRMTGAHLVVDFHEWFSENVHWDKKRRVFLPHQGLRKARWQALERRCLEEASQVITVCDSIADAMASELGQGRRPHVVRNVPALDVEATGTYPPLKSQLGIPEERFVVLYQGGLGPSRYLEPVIQALSAESRFTLVIRGPGIAQYAQAYSAIAEAAGVSDRLILAPAVPSRDVVAAARGADAGIWTLEALCRNFTYALPNKLFEYLTAGLPLLAADYPETRKLISTFDVGATFAADDPGSIAGAISSLIDNPSDRQRMARNTSAALYSLNAESEWHKLVEIYDSLRPSSATAA